MYICMYHDGSKKKIFFGRAVLECDLKEKEKKSSELQYCAQ